MNSTGLKVVFVMVFVVASSMADDAQRGDRDQTDDNNCTGANEEYKDCGNACELVCGGPEHAFCAKPCVSGCQCKGSHRRICGILRTIGKCDGT